MDKKTIITMKKTFDDIMHTTEDGSVEFWYARELMECLGYDRWENFNKAINRAIDSCKTSNSDSLDHFRGVTKMVQLGSGAERGVKDYMLTRYACYLIAQNGDPRKEEIAFAQSYFAVQTRKQELIEERIAYIERTEARGKLRESEKRLSQNIYERGVDDAGFGRIRSRGDQALFGGKSTQDMKKQLGISDKRPLADFLPNWINGFLGISGFNLCCIAKYDSARVELYFGKAKKEDNKKAFDAVILHKDAIENSLGVKLIWNRGDDIKSSKISYQINDVSIENETDWLQMAKFHAHWSKKFYDVIVPYLR